MCIFRDARWAVATNGQVINCSRAADLLLQQPCRWHTVLSFRWFASRWVTLKKCSCREIAIQSLKGTISDGFRTLAWHHGQTTSSYNWQFSIHSCDIIDRVYLYWSNVVEYRQFISVSQDIAYYRVDVLRFVVAHVYSKVTVAQEHPRKKANSKGGGEPHIVLLTIKIISLYHYIKNRFWRHFQNHLINYYN